jgi:hypothetical protein
MRIREGRKLRAESSVIRREVDARVIRGNFEHNDNMLDVMKINGVWAVTSNRTDYWPERVVGVFRRNGVQCRGVVLSHWYTEVIKRKWKRKEGGECIGTFGSDISYVVRRSSKWFVTESSRGDGDRG